MTPSWYDVLDVDESATPAEIRTAWKAAIADLDPGDRRFRLANQAAEVLLDPDKRAAHDAQLAAEAGVGARRGEVDLGSLPPREQAWLRAMFAHYDAHGLPVGTLPLRSLLAGVASEPGGSS